MKKHFEILLRSAVFAALTVFVFAGCSVDIASGIPQEAYYDTSFQNLLAKYDPSEGGVSPETKEPSSAGLFETEDETDDTDNVTINGDSNETTAAAADLSVYPEEFNEEDKDFLSRCVFVGDSICRGLAAYEMIPTKQVAAQGNIAARNIFDFTFTVDGEEMSILPALVNLKPEYIVFSMGMNDVNITDQQTFCDNYGELLSLTESFLPKSKLIVLSITPVTDGSTFTSNSNIDSFNEALKYYLDSTGKWQYVDVSSVLKGGDNGLRSEYESGDGIHLSPDAYRIILKKLCEANR